MWKKFANEEATARDTHTGQDAQFQRLLHTVVFLCSEVISNNWLHTHGQTQYNHYIECKQAIDDTVSSDGHIASVTL